jgi:hypothetical protein
MAKYYGDYICRGQVMAATVLWEENKQEDGGMKRLRSMCRAVELNGRQLFDGIAEAFMRRRGGFDDFVDEGVRVSVMVGPPHHRRQAILNFLVVMYPDKVIGATFLGWNSRSETRSFRLLERAGITSVKRLESPHTVDKEDFIKLEFKPAA